MKKSLAVILAIVMLLALALSGCTSVSEKPKESKPAESKPAAASSAAASEAPKDKKAEIVLKLGYGSGTTNPRHLTAEKFKKWVEEQTKGKVQIDLYPSEVLGTDKQMMEMITMGTLDLTLNQHSLTANYAPKLSVIELPFLFDSTEKAGKILDGPIGEELAKDLEKSGIQLLAYWENGIRQTTNSKRPIEKPEDLKGLKIRTPESKMTISIFKALGASPAPFSFAELYLALSQGTFDGQENPVTNIHASKFYEVQKYISVTNHKYETLPFLASMKVWQKLPEDVRKVLKEGAVKFAKEHRKMVADNEGKLLADLEAKGMKVSKPNLQPFRDATKSVYAEWEPVLTKELIEKVKEAAK